jgi:hypothetical protein
MLSSRHNDTRRSGRLSQRRRRAGVTLKGCCVDEGYSLLIETRRTRNLLFSCHVIRNDFSKTLFEIIA